MSEARATELDQIEQRLVFIFSAPRSGSTLLQRLIASSDEVYSDVESYVMFLALGLRRADDSAKGEGVAGLEQTIEQATRHLEATGAKRTDVLDKARRQMLDSVYHAVLAEQGKQYFLDKTPAYTRIAQDIVGIYPMAKYLVLLRNPLSLLYSSLSTWIKEDYAKLYWCHYDLLGALTDLGALLTESEQVSNLLLCRYEELVRNPSAEIVRIRQFLGIDLDAENVTYSVDEARINSEQNSFFGDPKTVHLHQQPKAEYAENWLKLADDPQLLSFALEYLDCLGDELLAKLGYRSSELKQALLDDASSEVRNSMQNQNLLSFKTAITQPDKRTREQGHEINRFEYRRRYGHIGALLYFVSRVANRFRNF